MRELGRRNGIISMFYYIFGGSSSGKSKYAEEVAISLVHAQNLAPDSTSGKNCMKSGGNSVQILYIATMKNDGQEACERIKRHQKQREKDPFITYEAFDLERLKNAPEASVILLDCLSNFTANIMFSGEWIHDAAGQPQSSLEKETLTQIVLRLADLIPEAVASLMKKCKNLIVVSDAVFSDGVIYDEMTEKYIRLLGLVGSRLAAWADYVTEIVFGIPVVIKAPSDNDSRTAARQR